MSRDTAHRRVGHDHDITVRGHGLWRCWRLYDHTCDGDIDLRRGLCPVEQHLTNSADVNNSREILNIVRIWEIMDIGALRGPDFKLIAK